MFVGSAGECGGSRGVRDWEEYVVFVWVVSCLVGEEFGARYLLSSFDLMVDHVLVITPSGEVYFELVQVVVL